MTCAVIKKNEMTGFFKELMTVYRLVAPVFDSGRIVFKQIVKPEEIVLDDRAAYKSPKEFLFPQAECILAFGDERSRNVQDLQPTVILGVRPCDLEAIKILNSVFTCGKYKDEYFENQFNNTILIGFGCEENKTGCFCDQRNIDKKYSNFCDAFMNSIDDEYHFELITEKGAKIFEGKRTYENTPENDSSSFPNCEILEIIADEKTLFEKPDWEKISEKCLGCGVCTFICPTCHCFDFKDVSDKNGTVRYRCWDSCMYPKFTLHASGHNPRPSKKERYRQRIMHKYHYIKENFGHIACTGCGRCIRSCPAGMNIKSVVKCITEELK